MPCSANWISLFNKVSFPLIEALCFLKFASSHSIQIKIFYLPTQEKIILKKECYRMLSIIANIGVSALCLDFTFC